MSKNLLERKKKSKDLIYVRSKYHISNRRHHR